MTARILWTAVLLLMAAGGFFGAAPDRGGTLDPFGILFLVVSGVVWFAWDIVHDGFVNRVDLMVVRFGPMWRRPDRKDRR